MSLEETIQTIVNATDAEMGISIQHIESGETTDIDATAFFPMCSVFKIPVMCEAFRQIHQGTFSLDDRWTLDTSQKNLPSGILVFLQDGLQLTVRDLLTLMIIISDNTATDMIMHRIGVDKAEEYMRQLGLPDIHVCMTVRDIFNDILGPEAADPARVVTNLTRKREAPPTNRNGRAYESTPNNDTSTPAEMTNLLAKICRGEVVDQAACDNMLHILLQQQLNDRLPRLLPYGIPFAHKTGTLSGIRNDAGILYANDNTHVAITAYSRWNVDAVEGHPAEEIRRANEIDQAFGEIGLAVYEHYKSHTTTFMPIIAN